ncbi:MAG: nucleoside-diphosphate kinase [Clostridium sp.]|uniref:nucleoside-diphosphate kinase n=1 Tax=Paraclostridium bifermentans TaxID=1490 RepID=UPI00189CA8D6|nr:nucleoside-diphosphate kinase [Paraclostridium bifermentans]MBQ8999224.1 nucleoside-diphosphate kinase [Clostridium sp.]
MERTLVLIKPDAVEQNIIGNIISCYESAGLKVTALKMEQVERKVAEEHYKEHYGKSFYNSLIEFITRSPLCALILEGKDCIDKVREINGATNPKEQKEGTIRKKYAKGITENCVHASDSVESSEREIKIWFPNLNNKK